MTNETEAITPVESAGPAQQVAVSRVEMVLDNYRVVGDIRLPGAPRRLVDTLNNNDLELIALDDVETDDPFTDLDEPRRFPRIEIVRMSVLFGMPRGGDHLEQGDAFETVEKKPVRCTIVLPGFEIRGNVYFIPGVRPEDVQILQQRNFVPVTEVRISASGGRRAVWEEPLAVVNLAQALFFAVDGDES